MMIVKQTPNPQALQKFTIMRSQKTPFWNRCQRGQIYDHWIVTMIVKLTRQSQQAIQVTIQVTIQLRSRRKFAIVNAIVIVKSPQTATLLYKVRQRAIVKAIVKSP